MRRTLALTLVIGMVLGAVPLAAYTEAKVDAARQMHIDGEIEDALEILMPRAEAGGALAQKVVAGRF